MKLTKRLTAGVLSALTLSMSTLSYSPVLAADEETEIVTLLL